MTTADQHHSCAPPTTRASVLNILRKTRDFDDDNDSLTSVIRSHVAVPFYDGATDCSTPLSPDTSLEEIRRWLDAQCDIEQSKADWTSEFDRDPRDGVDKLRSLGQGLDTAVLDRIRRGKGPGPAKHEDLLWPLRSEESRESSRFSKCPKDESYKAMEQVLRDWNKLVATAHDDSTARKAMMDAMHERIDFLDLLLPQRRSANTYDPTALKLRHAIHAYRPETAAFRTRDTCDLLTTILAHIGYAIPDIDQELKYLIFYTLVTERIHVAHEANAAERHKREAHIAAAKQQHDAKLVAKLEQKLNDWQHVIFQHNCNLIADKVKRARRNVAGKVLEELQVLTVLQSAQKMILNDRLSGSHSIPPISVLCDSKATALTTAVDAQLPSLVASAILVLQNNHDMEFIARERMHARARKFAGLDKKDISKAERDRLVEKRMANPDTVNMMGNAMQGIAETRTKAKEMLKAMDTMDKHIDEVLSKAQDMVEVYEALDKLVGPDPTQNAGCEVFEHHPSPASL